MKKSNIFIALSIIFLGFMVTFYGYRFIHYYKESHTSQKLGETLFSDILKTKSYDKNIKVEDKNLYYNGKVLNNYVFYSNRYYRILSMENGIITLIDDNVSTILPYENISEWLNTTYYNSLLNPDTYLNGKANLLTLEQYNKASNNGNFLKGNFFWLSDGSYVNEKGEVTEADDSIYGVRAVIALKDTTLYYGGTGTYFDPYLIDIEDANIFGGTKAETINIGSYIKYSDKVWRVIDNSNNYKLVATEAIGTYSFSENSNIYNTKDKTSIAHYLNNTYLNDLNKDLLVKGIFNIGSFENDYSDTKENTITEYVGLISMGDLFINDNDNYLTLTNTGLKNTIYKVVKGKLYADSYKSENSIIPVIYLDKNIKITEGYGTLESPFGVESK